MDRISDSGSDDWGSTPHGDTIKIANILACRMLAILFIPLCLHRVCKLKSYEKTSLPCGTKMRLISNDDYEVNGTKLSKIFDIAKNSRYPHGRRLSG